jgi:hypothetical protein
MTSTEQHTTNLTRRHTVNDTTTPTIAEDEFEAQVADEPGHGGYRFTVPMRLHLDAGSKAEALTLAMRWRDAIGCWNLLGFNGRDEALASLGFDWHLHHPWGC